MHPLEARTGPPILKRAAALLGILSQLRMLQGDARFRRNTKRGIEKPVYFHGRDVILIGLGEPVRAAI
jgi:hypothetical protein